MNSIVQQQFTVLEQTLAMRHQLLDIISDDDLNFAVEGNPTLGELCLQLGEYDLSYIDAFKTFEQKWGILKAGDPTVATRVDKLRSWFSELETEMKTALSDISEEDIQGKMVDRGHGGMQFPVGIMIHVYREALLIFYSKVTVYLLAMGKDTPQQWKEWIG